MRIGFIFLAIAALALESDRFLFHPLEDELERGRFSEAQKTGERDKDPVVAPLAAMFQGDYARAKQLIRKSKPPLDPLKSLGWERLTHYVDLMFYLEKRFAEEEVHGAMRWRAPARDQVLKGGARRAFEGCRKEVAAWLGVEPAQSTLIEIYRTKNDFASASTLGDELLKKSGVIGIAKFYRVMMITPEALPFGYSWQDTLCHEYIHHALKVRTGLALPLWFQEGMARAHEALWRGQGLELSPGDREALLFAAKEGRLVEFVRMEPSLVYLKDEEEISLAFTQVALAVDQLKPKLKALVDSVAGGKTFAQSFKAVYGRPLEDFEKELHASWREQAQEKNLTKRSGALRTVLMMGEAESAEKLFLGPQIKHLLTLGDRLRVRGNGAAALRLYQQAREQEPANPYVLSRIARAESALGKREEALITAKELARSNPSWPPVYEILGEIYESRGLYKDAVGSYRRYFDFNPYHKELYKKVAFLHIDLGEPRLALPLFEAALILDPKDAEAVEAQKAIKEKK